jgi:hypothetical protein
MVAAARSHAARSPAQQPAKKLAGYTVIVVEKFTVDKNPATEDFPKGLETMMQGRAVAKMREQKLFEKVIDAAEAPAVQPAASNPAPSDDTRAAAQTGTRGEGAGVQKPTASGAGERRVSLNGTVLTFDKGSRAARYFGGFGAGESKLKVRFILADAQTGTEVMRWDQVGTFKGMFSAFGGSQEEAFASTANGVVKGLIKEIVKNR